MNRQLIEHQQEIAQKNLQLEEASRLKSEFLAHMSHELRTPLNAIIGFSSALAEGLGGPLNEKQVEFTHFIFDGGKHLLSLINDILDLSKIEAGKMSLELETTDIKALLESSLSVVRERAVAHGITLQLDAESLGCVMADQRKTKQIIYNLLSNAVQFTPDGGAVILRLCSVRCAEVPANSLCASAVGEALPTTQFLSMSVMDTGIGIVLADLNRLFQPFMQLDSGLSRKYEGTGLGLALVKQLVELHNGHLFVQSEVGKGSTFTVWLPLLVEG